MSRKTSTRIDGRRLWSTAMLAAICTLPMAADAAAQTGPTLRSAAPAGPAAVPGEIVIGFRSGVDAAERAEARSDADVRAARNLLVQGGQLVKVERGQTVQEAITALEQRPDVRYAEPNWIYQLDSTTPDDPRFGSLWGLNNTGQAVNGHAAGTADDDIDAPEAWDGNRGSASTVVAVVDTGVAWDHPDLAPNIWSNADEIAGNGVDDDGNGRVDDVRGWDFGEGDNNPWDYDGHGTHVAGTVAARGNNGMGITGVAWQASIMPLKAANASGLLTDAAIANAFTYAGANGAKVVNASLSGAARSQAIADAISNQPNTLFVVTAGNGGDDGLGDDNETTPRYPCNLDAANLICVAATDNRDALGGFSNYGATSVDLAAPGVDIDSTRPHFTDSFTDDFQTDLSKWTVQSGSWGRVSANNTIWLTDSPGANYADNADWAIRTSSKVDVGTRTDCALRFRYATFLEAGFDWLDVQSSPDGTAWTNISSIGNTDGTIRNAFHLLPAGSRYYRFRLTSDATTNRNGVYIDNVVVHCPGGTYGSDDYRFLDGTSMAAPHVAGAATVLFSDTPLATVAEVKAALLDSGDELEGLSGKTVSGRRLNLGAALSSLVHKGSTTTTITSHDPDPSVTGQAVTVTYSVAVSAPDSGTPTGDVTVTDGSQSCTGTVAAGQCTITFTHTGTKSLTATYAGDANHYASPVSASVSHQVDRADTTTAITSHTPDPSDPGEPVTVSFTVAAAAPGAGTPTGTVVITDGVDDCWAVVEMGACEIRLTTRGRRQLTATYLGDNADFNGSASAGQAHDVNRLATTTTITGHGPDPSVTGQAVTVQYGVTASVPGAGPPTGNVTVSDGVDSCTGTVAAGQCTIALTRAGNRTLTAGYTGDGNFQPSSSSGTPHTVTAPSTSGTGNPPSSPGGQPPTVNPPSPTLAHVSGASLTNRTFRVSPKRKLAQITRRRPPVGTTIKYTLDAAAGVRFDFAQPGAGRTAGGKCVARNKRNQRRPKCALKRGSLTFAGHAGTNTVRFAGWLSRAKKLTPGKYSVTITAVTPGVGATSQQLSFRIVR